MPSLVTLVWVLAGISVSASAPTARPAAFNDFDILRLLFPLVIFSSPLLKKLLLAHDLVGKPVPTFPGHAPTPRRARDTSRRSRWRSACSRNSASASWSAS